MCVTFYSGHLKEKSVRRRKRRREGSIKLGLKEMGNIMSFVMNVCAT